MARQTLMALCAPGASAGENGPNTVNVDTLFALHDEGRHLAASRRDVGEAGRAEPGQETGDLSPEDVGREIDQHRALDDGLAFADRERFAPHGDALLDYPEPPGILPFAHRRRDRIVPRALGGFPSERHTGAAVLVVRLQHQGYAPAAHLFGEVLADDTRPGHVRGDYLALGAGELLCVAGIREDGEERLLVRDLAAQCIGDAHRLRAISIDQRPALVWARDDVVDQHAAVDEVDAFAIGGELTPVERQVARIAH